MISTGALNVRICFVDAEVDRPADGFVNPISRPASPANAFGGPVHTSGRLKGHAIEHNAEKVAVVAVYTIGRQYRLTRRPGIQRDAEGICLVTDNIGIAAVGERSDLNKRLVRRRHLCLVLRFFCFGQLVIDPRAASPISAPTPCRSY